MVPSNFPSKLSEDESAICAHMLIEHNGTLQWAFTSLKNQMARRFSKRSSPFLLFSARNHQLTRQLCMRYLPTQSRSSLCTEAASSGAASSGIRYHYDPPAASRPKGSLGSMPPRLPSRGATFGPQTALERGPTGLDGEGVVHFRDTLAAVECTEALSEMTGVYGDLANNSDKLSTNPRFVGPLTTKQASTTKQGRSCTRLLLARLHALGQFPETHLAFFFFFFF